MKQHYLLLGLLGLCLSMLAIQKAYGFINPELASKIEELVESAQIAGQDLSEAALEQSTKSLELAENVQESTPSSLAAKDAAKLETVAAAAEKLAHVIGQQAEEIV
jgi:hypothetical protein